VVTVLTPATTETEAFSHRLIAADYIQNPPNWQPPETAVGIRQESFAWPVGFVVRSSDIQNLAIYRSLRANAPRTEDARQGLALVNCSGTIATQPASGLPSCWLPKLENQLEVGHFT
jgi:hypothetical protein